MEKNNYKYTEEEVRAAYSSSVVDVVLKCGIPLSDEGKVYRVCGYGGLFLFKHGTGYYRFSDDEKGTGIDFLVKYCGYKTKQDAIGAVLNYSGRTEPIQYDKNEEKRGEFILPQKAENYNRLYYYLLSKRCLDKEIVYKLISEKKIYQEKDKGNCVFVGFDKNNIAKYATKRGTSDVPFKGEVSNSDKYIAFHINGNPLSHRVYVTESPIDAISHASLIKINGKQWDYDHHISLGCTSDRALQRFLEENPQITNIVFALDNDKDSEINHGQEAADKYIKKYSEMGYKCIKHVPEAKDFNEDLINFTQKNLIEKEEECEAETG